MLDAGAMVNRYFNVALVRGLQAVNTPAHSRTPTVLEGISASLISRACTHCEYSSNWPASQGNRVFHFGCRGR